MPLLAVMYAVIGGSVSLLAVMYAIIGGNV